MIVIIAIVMGMIGVSISRSISGAEMRSASHNVVAALRYTRTQAILKKSEQVFTMDTDERSYQAPGHDPVVLPEGMEVALSTARSELTSESVGGIRFFPDGGSTGGYVELNANGREYRINVAWLTGEATLVREDL